MVMVWLLFGLLPFLVFLVTSLLVGSYRLYGDKELGFIQDYVMLSYFVFIPTVISLAIVYFPSLSSVLHTLQELTVVPSLQLREGDIKKNASESTLSKQKFNKMLKRYEAKIMGKDHWLYLRILCIMIGLIWALVAAIAHFHIEGLPVIYQLVWSDHRFMANYILRTIYEFCVFGFVLPYFGFKFIAILHTLRGICKDLNKEGILRIRPLNPDRAGGLGTLGYYSLRLVIVIVPFLLPIILYTVFLKMSLALGGGLLLYIPFLFFTFIYPLSGAHDAMSKFKKQELQTLSKEFNRVYDEFVLNIKDHQLSEIPSPFELMEKLDHLYTKAEKMPVWPFNFEILSRFGALVATVGIPWLYQFITQAIT